MTEFSTKPKKKTIDEMTKAFRPFWENILDKNPDSYFVSKLAYTPKGSSIPSIRLFASELGKGDIYFEFHNWESTYYHNDKRVLYKLENDVNWKTKIGSIYIEAPDTENSFIINLNHLKVVEEYKIGTIKPLPESSSGGSSLPSMFDFEKEEPVSEFEDSHQTTMTIRDWYAIIQNKPVSNKKWLNKLIKTNT